MYLFEWASFGYMFRSGIVGSCGNSVCTFWGICNNLYSHQECRRIFFPILSSALVYSLFIDGHYDQCKLVLDCNFDLHLSSKVEHLFMCILIICVFWELSFGLLLIFWMVFSFEGFFYIEFCELIVLLLIVLNYFS